MSIGENIKTLREKRGLSQLELANVIGVTDKSVSAWELNNNIPRMGYIQKMADFFGVPKSVIIEDRENSDGETVHNIAAHAMRDLTEEEAAEVLKFAEYIKSQRKDK